VRGIEPLLGVNLVAGEPTRPSTSVTHTVEFVSPVGSPVSRFPSAPDLAARSARRSFSFLKCQITVMIRHFAFLSVGILPLPFDVAFYGNNFRLSIRNIRLLGFSALHVVVSSRTKCLKHPLLLPKHQLWYLQPLRRVVFNFQFHLIFRFSGTVA